MDPLDILFQDDYYVAVDKPAGLLVHRSKVDRHTTLAAVQVVRDMLGRRVYPVHRLDKQTSGSLMFALSSDAANRAMQLFAGRSVNKKYTAVVRGYVEESFEIDYPLKEKLDKKTDARARADKPAQEAESHVRRLARVELPYPVGRYATCRYSQIEVLPETGRKHQIRRHMKHIFHPILGDRKYGDWRHNRFLLDHFGCDRMLLHAAGLSFQHPYTGENIDISSPLTGDYLRVVREMFG